MTEWETGKPPNEQIVEVEDEGRIIRVRAMWGRDGMRPHWESEDRDTLWAPSAFTRWRPVTHASWCRTLPQKVHSGGKEQGTIPAPGQSCDCGADGDHR